MDHDGDPGHDPAAAFYFRGWDVSSNLAEETEDGRRNAGLGEMIGVLVVFTLFEISP